jgi:N-carbamoylputrescine amidase
MRAAAAEAGAVVVAPIYELDPASGKRFNTAVVIDERGELLGLYRKTHIPSGKNERAGFSETYYYEPSDGRMPRGPAVLGDNPYFPAFETSFGRIGVAICYDRHFEGVVHELAHAGAELILCPAVTFGAHSERMWELEFAVDAARNGVYVGGSNRRGSEEPWGVEFFGQSHFVGPTGPVPSVPAGEGLVVADLDLDALVEGDRSGWDLDRDGRPDIHGGGP